jgi:DNA processing protein
MNEDLQYQIGLSLTPNIGPIVGKTLIAYCGSAKAVFETTPANLAKIPSIGPSTASMINKNLLLYAENEINNCNCTAPILIYRCP